MRKTLKVALAIASIATGLSACSSSDQASTLYDYPVVDAYAGNDFVGFSGSNAFRLVVVGTQEYWLLYGNYTNVGFALQGFTTGKDVRPYPTTYTTGVSFGLPATGPANLRTLYDSAYRAVSGSMTTLVPGIQAQFSGAYYTPSGSSLTAVSGLWPLLYDLNGVPVSMNVDVLGGFSARTSNCDLSGTFSQSATVTGLLLIKIDDQFACLGRSPNTYSGVVFLENTPDSLQRQQVLIAANTASRNAGVGLYGIR